MTDVAEAAASKAQVLDRLKDVVARARENADAAEQASALPQESLDAMFAAGLPSVLVPRRFGGLELGLDAWFDIVREVAAADSSHGWCAGLMVHHGHFLGYFPEAAQEAVWADGPNVAVAGAASPGSEIVPTDGGYLVSGSVPFASGVLHSSWSFVGGMAAVDGGKPEWCWVLLPAKDYEVVDTWHTEAMSGTGSNTIVTRNAFVPEGRLLRVGDVIDGNAPGSAVHANPMYGLPMAAFTAIGFVGAMLGAARGAYEEFRDRTTQRKDATGARVAEDVPTQISLAEIAGKLDLAELVIRRAIEVTKLPEVHTIEMRARAARDFSIASELCRDAINAIVELAGTSAFARGGRLVRAWRDIHFMGSHMTLKSRSNFAHWGRVELGLGRAPTTAVY